MFFIVTLFKSDLFSDTLPIPFQLPSCFLSAFFQLLSYFLLEILPISEQPSDNMASIAVSQFQTQLQAQSQAQLQTHTRKSVRFAEDTQVFSYNCKRKLTKKPHVQECLTKTHDGMEFAKQVTEHLVYTFFYKRIITCQQFINPTLNAKFGKLDEQIKKRVVKLLMKAYTRVKKLLQCPDPTKKTPLFNNTTGHRGVAFTGEHKYFLRKLILWTKSSFELDAGSSINNRKQDHPFHS